MKLFQITIVSFLGILLLATGSQAFGGPVVNKVSCTKVDNEKAFPVRRIKDYFIQTIPINAFVFTTVKNKTFCANPNQDWVKNAITVLESKAKTRPMTQPEPKNVNKKPRKRPRQNKKKNLKDN